MRILVITVFPPFRAPEADYAWHLCAHLAAAGAEVHVLTDTRAAVDSCPGVTVHAELENWSWRDLPRFARIARRCAPGGILLLYIGWVYDEHPMITFAPTYCKAMFPGVPFVCQFALPCGAYPKPATRPMRSAVALWAGPRGLDRNFGSLLRDSHHIILMDGAHGDRLTSIHPGLNGKATVLPPPPIMQQAPDDKSRARLRGRDLLRLSPDVPVVAYLGYIYPGKGVETLLRGFRGALEHIRDLRLVLVGGVAQRRSSRDDSYVCRMKALPRALGIEERVIWTGGYDWNSVEPSLYLRAADVCVLPFDEGLATHHSSFATAAAHDLPIISTRGAGTRPPLADGQNVHLCPARDPEALARAVHELLASPAARQRLAEGAAQVAREHFSWEKTAAFLSGVFEKRAECV